MIRRPPRSTLMTHSFPTRRSSYLVAPHRLRMHSQFAQPLVEAVGVGPGVRLPRPVGERERDRQLRAGAHQVRGRTEEHTSELQSLMRNSYAVFCLKK